MCSFAHVINKWNLIFLFGKNKRNDKRNKTEDAKFYQIKSNLFE